MMCDPSWIKIPQILRHKVRGSRLLNSPLPTLMVWIFFKFIYHPLSLHRRHTQRWQWLCYCTRLNIKLQGIPHWSFTSSFLSIYVLQYLHMNWGKSSSDIYKPIIIRDISTVPPDRTKPLALASLLPNRSHYLRRWVNQIQRKRTDDRDRQLDNVLMEHFFCLTTAGLRVESLDYCGGMDVMDPTWRRHRSYCVLGKKKVKYWWRTYVQ